MRTILILASNPRTTKRLRLDEEVKKIEQGLERSKRRDQFKLVVKWAVTDDELRRAMLDNEPEIVHFSGHGSGESQGGQGRDLVPVQVKESGGLAFEDDGGHVQLITGDALARLFELCADSVKCVVLNACYSEAQANAISQHIDYVVGMKKAIGDEAAIKFAVGFYDALGAGRDFETAYKFGCSAIDLKGIPEYLTPVLKKKSISVTVPTPPSSASPPDASSAGSPGHLSGVHSPSVLGFGTASVPDGDPGKIVSAAGTSSPTSATAKITWPIRLFYSYSHKDEELRKELEDHLSLLRRQGVISGWHDRMIGAGEEWKGQLDKNLEESQIILLLISPSFLASDYCYDIETKRALDRHDKGEATVIPVLLRPVDWEGAPFARLQGLPIDLRPVTTWTNKDEALKNIAQGIRRAIAGMRNGTR
ncbi:MAG: TIR domain-containing protein [Planctomycetaceae bacterium]|nr:TIR domain-containing protein [Planctomycetaceae bacterium]